jgi:hypothetical protein
MINRFLLSGLLLLGGISQANAAIVLSETFSYPDGSLTSANGSPWTTNSGTAGQLNVVGGELFIDDNETEDARADFSTFAFSGDVVTANLRVRFSTLDVPAVGQGNYFAHFIGDTDLAGTPSDFMTRVYALAPNIAGAGRFTFGIANSTGTLANVARFTTDFDAGTDYDLTMTFNVDTDTSALTVAGGGTIVATDVPANMARIGSFGFRQSANTGDQFVDNLVVNVTAVPEPTSIALVSLVGGSGLFAAYRKRRKQQA